MPRDLYKQRLEALFSDNQPAPEPGPAAIPADPAPAAPAEPAAESARLNGVKLNGAPPVRRLTTGLLGEPGANTDHFFELSQELLCVLTGDGYFQRVNPAFERLLGWPARELLKTAFLDLVHPGDMPATLAELDKLRLGAPAVRVVNRFRCRDGSDRWIAWIVQAAAEGALDAIGHDITERRQSEEALRESEARYRSLIESSHDAVVSVGPDGRFIFFNQVWLDTLGYAPEELSRLTLFDLMRPDSLAHCQPLFIQLLGGQALRQVEVIFQKKDGASVIMEANSTARWSNGQVVATQSIFRDVTARKRAEAELHRFRYALDRSTDAVFMTDPNGVIQYVNTAFEKTYGYSAAEVVGQTPRLLKSGLVTAEQYAYFWQTLLGGQPVAGEIINKTKAGRLIPVEGANTPILDEAGAILGFMAVHRDVTERKQIEERLRLQASALDSAANAIIITNRAGAIEWVNPAFTQLTGYSLEEATGGNPRLLKSGQHDAAFYQQMWATIQAGQLWRGEIINRRKDGSLYTEEITITSVKDDRGQVSHFIAIMQDITARKTAETHVAQHTAELEALNVISQILTSQQNLDALVRQVGDQVMAVFASRSGFIALYDAATEQVSWPYFIDAGVYVSVAPRPLSQGPTSYVVRERRPLLINHDINQRMAELGAYYTAGPDDEIAQSWLGVPILTGETVIGALSVSQPHENAFTDDDIRLLSTMAANLGAAFQTARLLEQVQARVAELNTLNTIVSAAAGSLDVQQILDVAAREAAALVRARSCGVALLDADGLTLTVVAEHGDPGHARSLGAVIPVAGNRSSELALTEQRTVVIANAQTDPLTEPIHALMRERQTHALVIVPLVTRHAALGTIALDSADPEYQFDARAINLLETIARQVASAVETARLFVEARKRATELATVAAVGTAVATVREPQTMLEAVVDLAKERFQLYHAHVYLLNAEGDTLVLTAGAGEVGRQMVAEGRRIALNRRQSLVAQAARERRAVIVNDVTADPNFLPHPLLPATRAELAVPLLVGGQVLGVLDVQAAEAGRFTAADANIQTTLAAQVAVALENARSFERSEKALAELNALTRRLSRESWQSYLRQPDTARAFMYDLSEVQAVQAVPAGVWEEEAGQVWPLEVQGAAVGRLAVAEPALPADEAAAITAAVAERLSAHLENLRLTEQTMESLSRQERLSTQLETVAQVSTVASTILESRQLLQAVVDLTRERFGLYHAQVYLYDEVSETLHLAAASGELGRALLTAGQIIPAQLERAAVAQAVQRRAAVIVEDRHALDDDLRSPALPDARAELAVPMLVGDHLLGVFHVLADRPAAFSDEDARIQSTLAAQVAIALQNANLYAEQAATVNRLRELDQLKSSFLANMSHELRTPLNSIIGFTDVILEGLDGALTDRMETDLKVVQKNGQHLLNLINDILDMAKIEAGRMTISPEPLDVADVVAEVLDITGSLAREKRLYLRPLLPEAGALFVEADHIRLRQVLINLIGNSVKFTETGGVTISAERQGERVLICVRDTGIGIPANKLESIFEAFSQVDTSTTRKTGGTGLGLPISRHLIELHGGRLWAESRGAPGEGARFFIDLPAEFKALAPADDF